MIGLCRSCQPHFSASSAVSRSYFFFGCGSAALGLIPAFGHLSLIISRAALRPHAPITPPPGCVAAPHIYSPFTGVR